MTTGSDRIEANSLSWRKRALAAESTLSELRALLESIGELEQRATPGPWTSDAEVVGQGCGFNSWRCFVRRGGEAFPTMTTSYPPNVTTGTTTDTVEDGKHVTRVQLFDPQLRPEPCPDAELIAALRNLCPALRETLETDTQ